MKLIRQILTITSFLNIFYFSTIPVQAAGFEQSEILALVNNERTANELKPLTLNQKLIDSAKEKAGDIFKNQTFAHNQPDSPFYAYAQKNDYAYETLGENLAIDYPDAQSTIRAWMNSPSHKENIMNGAFNETGIWIQNGTFHDVPTTVVVQYFGQSKLATSAAISTSQPISNSLTYGIAAGLIVLLAAYGTIEFGYLHHPLRN